MAADIIHLPRRATSRKAGRRRPTSTTCQVLKFTGSKKYVYDREEVHRKHLSSMRDQVLELYTDVCQGKVMGFMLVTTEGHWGAKGHMSLGGTFFEDERYVDRLIEMLPDRHRCLRDRHLSAPAAEN